MFAANLRNYVFQDSKRRLRDGRVSLLIAFVISAFRLAIGDPEGTVAIEGLAILAICLCVLTVYYCRNAALISFDRSRFDSGRLSMFYRPVSRRLAWVSAWTIAVLGAIPEVEAAALDRRLRNLTKSVPLDRERIDRVARTLNDVDVYRVKIPRGTIADLRSALEKTANASPDLVNDAVNAGSLACTVSTIDIGLPKEMHGPLFDRLPEAKGAKYWFTAIATNTGSDSYSTIGLARQPDVAKMEPISAPNPVVSEYGPGFLIAKDMTARLDGYRLKHVVFQNMHLTYDGGSLILEDVYFFNCRLQFRPSENSWQLMAAIIQGGWIRYLAR